MKKIKTLVTLLVLLFSINISAQSCFSCTPQPCAPWQNTDLLQIYCAIKNGSGGSGGTSTVTGNVGGYDTKINYVVPTPSSSTTFTAGNNIGGFININSLCRTTQSNFIVYEVEGFDYDGNTPPMTIDFFSIPFQTVVTNTPTDLSGNIDRYLGTCTINQSDWITTGGISRFSVKYVGIVMVGIEKNILITTNSNVTYTGTNRLNVKIGALQD